MGLFLDDIERLHSDIGYKFTGARSDLEFSLSCCGKDPSDSNKKCLEFSRKKESILRDIFELSEELVEVTKKEDEFLNEP